MVNTVNNQPTATSLQLTDYVLGYQPAQSPPTRKIPLSQYSTYWAPLTGATFTGAVTISSGGLTVSAGGVTVTGNSVFANAVTVQTGGLAVSAGGVSITGNSTITGTLGGLTGLTVASGGAAITGNSTITGSLGGITGLTVASGGAVITGNSSIAGTLTTTNVVASGLSELGTLNNLVAASAILSVQSTTGLAAQFMSSVASASNSVQVRKDRTDGALVGFLFGASTTVGTITTDGTTSAYNTTSDQNLKINVGRIAFDESADIIRKLCAHWFTWRVFAERAPEPGFFAQEVYRVYPWAVTKGRGRPGSKFYRPWQMDAGKLMPALIAFVQGLDRRITELERR